MSAVFSYLENSGVLAYTAARAGINSCQTVRTRRHPHQLRVEMATTQVASIQRWQLPAVQLMPSSLMHIVIRVDVTGEAHWASSSSSFSAAAAAASASSSSSLAALEAHVAAVQERLLLCLPLPLLLLLLMMTISAVAA